MPRSLFFPFFCHSFFCSSLPLFLLLLLQLAGCEGPAGGEASPSPAKKPELVFRFALQPNPANKVWEAANLVRQELEERSDGRIQVMFYDSGTLGAERQILETCYLGVVEMVQCTSSVVTTIEPTFSLLDMPYLFIDEEHHQRVMNGPIGQELLDGLRRHRLQGLAFYSCGSRNMFNRAGREIRRPEDMKGLKIRVMESPVMLASLNAMGASATPLSAGEMFQALKTGVVDGAENNPQVFISEKFYEAGCMNFSKTRHFANQHVLVGEVASFGEVHASGFVELFRNEHLRIVLGPVDHAGLQRLKHLAGRKRRGARAHGVERSEHHRAFHHADFQPFHVFRAADLAARTIEHVPRSARIEGQALQPMAPQPVEQLLSDRSVHHPLMVFFVNE